mmetsp:Transcript_59484/g.172317  ORF Transcript_59484/g.172317 Transcript_59484/m.172317 type:complete len:95 (-) Transcript_59484:1074-1358(-)
MFGHTTKVAAPCFLVLNKIFGHWKVLGAALEAEDACERIGQVLRGRGSECCGDAAASVAGTWWQKSYRHVYQNRGAVQWISCVSWEQITRGMSL